MISRLFALCALCVSSSAFAGGHEVNFEAGGLEQRVRGFYSGVPRSFGFSGGGAVLEDVKNFGLVVRGGWQRTGSNGGSNGFFSTQEEGDALFTQGYTSRASTDYVSLGLKADYSVADIFYPYVGVAGLVAITQLELGASNQFGDPLVNERRTGAAPGVATTGGIEFSVPRGKLGWPVAPAVYVEGGYAWVIDPKLGNFGTADLGGFVFRAGAGLRF